MSRTWRELRRWMARCPIAPPPRMLNVGVSAVVGVVVTTGLAIAMGATSIGCANSLDDTASPSASDAGPPPAPRFTNLSLKIRWDSPILASPNADAPKREPTVRRGGRIRTGQPLRVHVGVPSTNRALTDVSMTLDGTMCSTLAAAPAGFSFVALCGIDIDRDPGDAPLVVTAAVVGDKGKKSAPFEKSQKLQVVEGDYDERSLKVKKKFVKPPPSVDKRIKKERATIKEALASNIEVPTWAFPLKRPVDKKQTSPFGTQRTYNDVRESRHLGLDLDGKTGDPIVAIASGKVVMVEKRYFSGGTVVIDHGQSLFSLYFHMSKFDVKPGDDVKTGQRIGNVGRSGRVTGPHLHLSVKIGGHYIDPKTLLAFAPLASASPSAPLVPAKKSISTAAGPERIGGRGLGSAADVGATGGSKTP